MRHPSEFYIKFLIVRHPDWNDDAILKHLQDWGILPPPSFDIDKYLPFLRADMPKVPDEFDPLDLMHRPSINYLRDLGILECFRSTPEMQEAWDILAKPDRRLLIEQLILSRVEPRKALHQINKRTGWYISELGLKTFKHYFWNVDLLTFDDWGRFLYGRAALYERHMALLQGDERVAYFHLRLEQQVESKDMIRESQNIAYHTLLETKLKPGTGPDKVKAITVLAKAVVECHVALSTSDMALKDVLQQFERFRVEHPHPSPPDIHRLAPDGNYSGGGLVEKDKANGVTGDLPN